MTPQEELAALRRMAELEAKSNSDLASKITLPGADLRSAEPTPVKSGSFLPISQNAQGENQFDSDAGALGFLKRLPGAVYEGTKDAMSLTGDVYAGKAPPDDVARNLNFAAMATPMPASMRAGERVIAGEATSHVRGKAAVPTADELREAAEKGYDTVRNSGVTYKTSAVNEMAMSAQQAMEKDGFRAEQSPSTFSILADLQKTPEGSFASIADLDSARKALNRAAGNFNNPAEQAAAQRAIEKLDEFIKAADPQSLMAGTAPTEAQRLAKALEDARGNYASAKRSDRINGTEERADISAAASNSGQNSDNAIRQRFASILKSGTGDLGSGKLARGFSDDELGAIEDVVRGSKTGNSARYVGNLLGKGGGMAQMLATALAALAGGAAGGVEGGALAAMVPGAIGASANKMAEALTRRGVRRVDEMARERSPLFRSREAGAPMEARLPTKAEALSRALSLMKAADEEDFKRRGGI